MLSALFDFTGKDSLLLARILVFFQALFAMDIFKNKISVHFSQEYLQGLYDNYAKKFEVGMFGDRNGIAQRKPARKELVDACKKVLSLLSALASEEDMIILKTAGVELRKPPGKGKKRVVVPATAES